MLSTEPRSRKVAERLPSARIALFGAWMTLAFIASLLGLGACGYDYQSALVQGDVGSVGGVGGATSASQSGSGGGGIGGGGGSDCIDPAGCGTIDSPCCICSAPCTDGSICGDSQMCSSPSGVGGASAASTTMAVTVTTGGTGGAPPPPPCGNQGQGCCGGTACSGGLSCQGGACQPCGGQGQACCPACGGGLSCQGGACQPCGGQDQACCPACGGNLLCDGTFCRECCASCKNFGQFPTSISYCQGATLFSDLCKSKNKCGTANADPCCPQGTCTNPNGNGLCN